MGGGDALAGAEVTISARFVNQRLAAVPLEPSAYLAAPDPDRPGGLVLWTPSQGAHGHRDAIAPCLGSRPSSCA